MQKLLIISQVWPEPNSSAAGVRMLQLIHFFLAKKFQITFAATTVNSDFAIDLKSLGIKTNRIFVNDPNFDDFLQEENPQIVLFDRFMLEEQFGWRVAQICPQAIRILDTEDLHFLRKARQKAFKENKETQRADLFSETAKREIASIFRSDLSLIISEVEMNLLVNHFKIDKKLLFYLPFLMEEISENTIRNLPSFEDRTHFVSIGNFLHPPNSDMVHYLKTNIWPLIRKELPEAQLHLYGAYSGEREKRLHDPKNGFLIKGKATDVGEVLQNAKILLAPLRFGAGLKGKIFDAMRNGTPSVTTKIGAEGIPGNLLWCGEIANSSESLAKAAVRLYHNSIEWEKAQKSGFAIIQKRFQKSAFEAGLSELLLQLQQQLKKHREKNFIGSMLMHHTMQSTKYMAKWIEEKNKKTP